MGPCSSFAGDLFDHHIWFVKRTNHIFHIHGWEWWGCLIDGCNAWMHFWPWHASEIMWKMGGLGEGISVECNKRGLPYFHRIDKFVDFYFPGMEGLLDGAYHCMDACSPFLFWQRNISQRDISLLTERRHCVHLAKSFKIYLRTGSTKENLRHKIMPGITWSQWKASHHIKFMWEDTSQIILSKPTMK